MTVVKEKTDNVVVRSQEVTGDVKKLKELKSDKRFEGLIPLAAKQFKAYEQSSIELGELHSPIIYWLEENIVIDGYASFRIANAHPDLKFTLISVSLKDWKDATVMVVEKNLSRVALNLFQKSELGVKHEYLLELKAKARQNQGCTGPVQSKDKIDVLQIIADKIGCGRTTVAHFKKIYEAASKEMLKECREGKLSIDTAYNTLFPPEKNSKGKSATGIKEKDMPMEMVTEGCNIFDECEKGIDVGKKNIKKDNGTPIEPRPIAEKMQVEKIAPGRIWIALNKDKTAIQVFKKSVDKIRGVITVKVNCYNSHLVSAEDGVVIFEADHINGPPAELVRKDDLNFDKKVG